MKRLGLAALLVLSACGPRPDADAARLSASATEELKYGDLATALTETERGLELVRGTPASELAWTLRLQRAEILLLQRRTADVPAILQETPPADAAFARVRARHATLAAQLLLFTGKLPESVTALTAAQHLAETAGDTHSAFSARTFRGQAEMRLGRWDDGHATQTALAADAERAGDDYHLAIALINLGRGALEQNRYDAALPYLERAASLARVTMRIRGIALNNAGLCYTRLGDYERAVAVQRRAVEAHERGAPVFLSQALGELGTTYLQMRNMPEAVSQLTRALTVATDARLSDLAELWAAHLANVHIEQRNWDEAERFNRQSRERNEAAQSPRLVYNILNDADIAVGRGQHDKAAGLYRSVLDASTSDPFNTSDAHAGLARCAVAAGRKADAARHFETALRIIEQTQSGLRKADYKFTYLTRITDRYGEYLAALMADGRVDRALEVADSSRARVLAERHGVSAGRRGSAADFKRLAAQTGSTLLLYWLGRESSYGWAVTAQRIESIRLPRAADLEALVREHQTAIVTSVADLLRAPGAGDKLYSTLVAPFAALIPPNSSVIIVPDAALARVNFETLPVSGPPRRYWIQDVTVTVAPSLGTLAAGRMTAAAPRAGSVLLFGDPAPSDPEFPRLQYANAEIDAVAKAFPAAEKAIYRGERASPAAFLKADPQRFSLIHFTAHASANAESPLDSAVILARDAGGHKLYARDIAEQRLNADLVTISACRSAGDRAYSGEGLVGFAWAFLRAGARRVLAGLWDVDDRSTAQLMTTVYAKLAEGQRPADALRSAKLALLAQGGPLAKPYYWGPFQLIVAMP